MMRLAATAILAVLSMVQLAYAQAAVRPDYNHRSLNADVTFPVVLRPNEEFTVTVRDTCETEFDYQMVGIKNAPTPPPAIIAFDGGLPPQRLTTKVLNGTYDAQFGSYLLRIERKAMPVQCVEWVDKAGNPAAPPEDALKNRGFQQDGSHWQPIELNEVDIVIAVTALEWEVGQDAALTLTPQASRKWTTEPTVTTVVVNNVSTQVTKFKVVRDKDGEDAARFTFATLTHFYAPTKNNGLALGFGLVDNKAEYYFGWSWGLGPRNNRVLNIAAGGVLTPVSVLPRNINEDDVLENAASLAPADFRTPSRLRPFVAVTATFFRTRTETQKPQAVPGQ